MQRFWGCKDYPKCNGTRNVDGDSREKREQDNDDEPKWKRRYD